MKNLKIARNESGYTQKSLALLLNISLQSYSDYENERTEPDLKTLSKIADLLNCSVDYLLDRTDDFGSVIASPTAPLLSEEESNLLTLFHKMTHAQKVRFMAYGEGMVGIDVPKFNA